MLTVVPAEEVSATWNAAAEKIFTQIVWKAAEAFETCGMDSAMAHVNAEKLANDVFREFRLSVLTSASSAVSGDSAPPIPPVGEPPLP